MKTTILAASCALFLGGMTTADTINVPGDYATINEAFNNASSGDVIAVSAGVYQESNYIDLKLNAESAEDILEEGKNILS